MGNALHTFRFPVAALILLLLALPAEQAAGMEYGEIVARAVLFCYHPTGMFVGYHTQGDLATAISHRSLYSANLDINYRGILTGNPYSMGVAILLRWHEGSAQVRAAVLRDTALMPPDPECELGEWMDVGL